MMSAKVNLFPQKTKLNNFFLVLCLLIRNFAPNLLPEQMFSVKTKDSINALN